eukprot:1151426-Pelagomonas_calceolata.AAC.4
MHAFWQGGTQTFRRMQGCLDGRWMQGNMNESLKGDQAMPSAMSMRARRISLLRVVLTADLLWTSRQKLCSKLLNKLTPSCFAHSMQGKN